MLKLFFKTDTRKLKPRELSKLWWEQDLNSLLPLEPNSSSFHHANLLPEWLLALVVP